MKRVVVLWLMMSAFFFQAQAWEPTKSEARQITREFIRQVMSGNLKRSLNYFAPEYVRTQHDSFLEGRTAQFVSEFIGGNVVSKSGVDLGFVSPDYTDIASMKVKKVEIGENVSVLVEVKLHDGTRYHTVFNMVVVDGDKLRYYGAVG